MNTFYSNEQNKVYTSIFPFQKRTEALKLVELHKEIIFPQCLPKKFRKLGIDSQAAAALV